MRTVKSASVADPAHTAPEPIKIVLADDHAMVRGGLRRVLESAAELTVVAEAGDVHAALQHTRAHQPHVVVLDLHMPGAPTLPAIEEFVAASPRSVVLVLTMERDPAIAREALSEGARGYVLKEEAEAELVEAVRAVVAGRTYLAPSIGAQLATMATESARHLPAWGCPTVIRSSQSARALPVTGSTPSSARVGWASSSGRPIARSTARWRSS